MWPVSCASAEALAKGEPRHSYDRQVSRLGGLRVVRGPPCRERGVGEAQLRGEEHSQVQLGSE